MAQQTINIGSVANDGTGDPARTAFDKVNDNFDELYFRTGAFLHGRDFGLAPSDSVDQTTALNTAIQAASDQSKALIIAPGAYRYTTTLSMPYNSHIIGCGGSSFGTALIGVNGAGIHYDGTPTEKFHASLTDIMLEQVGTAGAFVLKVENTYSLRFNRVRIHPPDAICTDAVVVIEDTNNDIVFRDLMFQTGSPGQAVGIRLKNGCGTIKFYNLDVENCDRNIRWEGGKIELYSVYMENAGINSIDLKPNIADTTAYFRCFGGEIIGGASANTIGVQDNVHDVDFYGTQISGSTSNDIYLADPSSTARFNLWGVKMDYSKLTGVTGWMGSVCVYGRRLLGSKTFDWSDLAPLTSETTTVTVTGAKLGYHTARANMSISTGGLLLFAWVSADNTVSVTAFNPNASGGANINLASATLYAFADPAPIR